ncbi:unnamed protein product, partial [Linum tenue]
KFQVDFGEKILLGVINAALNQEYFFVVANHKLTIMEADDSYTKLFTTFVIMVGPCQTTNVLLKANQIPNRYYMATRAYQRSQNAAFDNTTTSAVLEYKYAPCNAKNKKQKPFPSTPILSQLLAFNETNTT